MIGEITSHYAYVCRNTRSNLYRIRIQGAKRRAPSGSSFGSDEREPFSNNIRFFDNAPPPLLTSRHAFVRLPRALPVVPPFPGLPAS